MTDRRPLLTNLDVQRLREITDRAYFLGKGREPSVRNLTRALNHSDTVDARTVPGDVVTMNSRVRIHDLAAREVRTVVLVYPSDNPLADGCVSVLAPLGLALLGARRGEIVTWQAPAGERSAQVLEIEYQPESSGDFHR